MKVGFIGLGIMGGRMAARILEGGHELFVYNRTRNEGAEELIGKGANWMESPADLASQADVIITMLADPPAVRELALGAKGIFAGAKTDQLWIDSSTVNPSFSREMAKAAKAKGLAFLDAPVAGSTAPAEKGELFFLVGGPDAAVEKAAPLFALMGKKTLRLGEHGAGSSMKLVVNLLLGQSLLAFSEAFALGRALGLPSDGLFNVLTATPVTAPIIAAVRPKLETGNFKTNFPLKHMLKDLNLAAKTADETGLTLDSGRMAAEIFGRALEAGKGDLDFTALFKFLNQEG